jgi:heme-degrading monooxygenase HmoA
LSVGGGEPAAARSLFAVVFLVDPDPQQLEDYLAIAGDLRPRLTATPGFIENERFRSRSNPGRLLSLSLWEDEKALVSWRTAGPHHAAQVRGRAGVLAAYGLRVGEVTRATGRFADGRRLGWMRRDETRAGSARALVLVDGIAATDSPLAALLAGTPERRRAGRDPLEADVYDHLRDEGRIAFLTAWRTLAEAQAFGRVAARRTGEEAAVLVVRVVREYGIVDRVEAPQYFP